METKVKQKWDTEFATFFWNIYLDPKHPFNSTPLMTGYSKVRDQSEAQDKDYLLKRKICMLYNNKYFERITRIEIFTRVGDRLSKDTAAKIIVLYPKHYDIPELHHDIIFKKFGSWLHRFYDLINNGQSIDSIIPAVRKGVDKDTFIDPHKYTGTTVLHLYEYATRLLRHGHAQGAVEAFILKVKQLKNWQKA